MTELAPMIKSADGSYRLAGDPDSIGSAWRLRTRFLHFRVVEWILLEGISGLDPVSAGDPHLFATDDPKSQRLRCRMESDEASFFSISEEGMEAIEDEFILDIVAINEGFEGGFTHWPSIKTLETPISKGKLSASLGVPQERFDWFVRRLEAHGPSFAVQLFAKSYRQVLEEDLADPGLKSNLALAHGQTTKILGYRISIMSGPSRETWDLPRDERDQLRDEWLEEEALEPLPAAAAVPRKDRRIDFIVWLLLGIFLAIVFT